MSSLPNDAVFPVENIDDDNEIPEFEEEEEEDEHDVVFGEPYDDEPSPSTFSAITTAVVALPCTSISTVVTASPEPKRQRTEQMEEKRGLFQRLWTDEDEIGLLQGFLEYTANRGSSHHNDTALFYDQIKSKLQLDFNKNQLVEKLRRLKKKYRKTLNKIDSGKEFFFKSPHDQATFEISRKIWNNTVPIGGFVEDDDEIKTNPNSAHTTPLKNCTVIGKKAPQKRLRLNNDNNNNNNNDYDSNNNYASNNNNDNDNCNGKNSIQSLIEEKVRSCLSPVLKELASSGMRSSPFGFALNTMPLSFLNMGSNGEMMVDEKWRKQQVLELEVYSKRLELVQEEIKVALEGLRSVDNV